VGVTSRSCTGLHCKKGVDGLDITAMAVLKAWSELQNNTAAASESAWRGTKGYPKSSQHTHATHLQGRTTHKDGQGRGSHNLCLHGRPQEPTPLNSHTSQQHQQRHTAVLRWNKGNFFAFFGVFFSACSLSTKGCGTGNHTAQMDVWPCHSLLLSRKPHGINSRTTAGMLDYACKPTTSADERQCCITTLHAPANPKLPYCHPYCHQRAPIPSRIYPSFHQPQRT
jgi:hypothetical protein